MTVDLHYRSNSSLTSSGEVNTVGSHRLLADTGSARQLPQQAGAGLKPQHFDPLLRLVSAGISGENGSLEGRPAWLEIHPQNYFMAGGPQHRWLSALAADYTISFHSVGLSLGSARGLNHDELNQLARLCERYEPAVVSDHLSWSEGLGSRYPDLLPMPYTEEALVHFAGQVAIIQDRLKRRILIENPSRYLAFVGDEMSEAEFLHRLCRSSGCGLLLDLNNIEVSATNLGLDCHEMADAIDPTLVEEVHLAGHAIEHHPGGPLLIDDHGSAVSDLTWDLFARFIERSGPRPTLIEWDTDVPEWSVLAGEMIRAQTTLDAACEQRAPANVGA